MMSHVVAAMTGRAAPRAHAGCVVLAGLMLVAAPLEAARVQIVLDASGSMRGRAQETTKIDAAKEAVKTTVDALDGSSIVALRLYGHRRPAEPKAQSCKDTELVIPFGRLDRARFIDAVDAARPLGQTPLAYALQQAAADFGDLGDEAAAVILVSDGEESCGGDPVAVACAFAERGLELTIHTVGFDVDAAARAQLQAVARCTGGEYRDARNASDLSESLQQLTQAGLLITKQRETVAGQEIRGGDGFASAVAIAPGVYNLDHHQRPTEYDYFAIDLEPGHLLRVSQESYEVGIQIQGDTFREWTSLSAAGVALYGPDRARLAHQAVVTKGNRAAVATSATSDTGGRYFIAIGHDNTSAGGIHKSSPITLEVLDQTDAGSGTDAGSTDRDALAIAPGRHRAWLHPAPHPRTDRDVYVLAADPATTYDLRVRPDDEHTLTMSVADEDGVRLAAGTAPNAGAAVRLEGVRPARAGRLFVTVEGWLGGAADAVIYELELATGRAASDQASASGAESSGDAGTAATQDVRDAKSSAGVGSRLFRLLMVGVFATLMLVALIGVVAVLLVRKRRSRPPAPPAG